MGIKEKVIENCRKFLPDISLRRLKPEKLAELAEFDAHEIVFTFENKNVGLKGFIAIHNTNRGPAVGGTRYWKYASEKDALRDVLNLSKAMTYKCAIAGVSYGGGKGVLMADPRHQKTAALLGAYTHEINKLKGRFYTGEDVGIDENDVRILSQYSRFIIGRPGVGGDPSPWAALGVFYAIQASLEFLFGSLEIKNHTFAIKGIGKVGNELCRLLYQNGAKITVADIDPARVASARKSFPNIAIANSAEIHKKAVDVYCPCALGSEFTKQTIAQLPCKIICGGANNQLENEKAGKAIHEKGILYIPDYVANAGGLINVVAELDQGGYNKEHVVERVRNIKKTVHDILTFSKRQEKSTAQVADELARSLFVDQ